MTPSEALRRAIEAHERALAELRQALAEIERGDAPAAKSNAPLIGSHLSNIKSCAPRLGISEKSLRKIAPTIGAEVRLGGRILIDERAVAAHLGGKILPNSSTDEPTKISDGSFEPRGLDV